MGLGILAFVGPNQGGFGQNEIGPQIFKTACLVGSGPNCFNRASGLMVLAAIIVVALFLIAFSSPKLVPTGLQNAMEAVVEFIRNGIVMEVMGPEGLPWVPFLTSMFMFIFVCNVFEILPFINFPATSRIAIPLVLAVVVWFCFNIVGFKEQGLGYLRSTLFPPGVPIALYILVTPIEFVSTFLVRPFSLSVRLLGNMFAGHLILTIFALGTVYLMLKPATIAFAPFAFALAVFLTGFELLVAVLQAYIFTILTAVYIGGAMHAEH
ncbi:MAG: F0F1 ATP synthase subunit A [Actinomycetota bacterium]